MAKCWKKLNFMKTITTKGGDELARFIFSREGASENFEKLAKAGRLDLSLEAQVVDNKYASLFSDNEVNYCFMLLVDEGYFVI